MGRMAYLTKRGKIWWFRRRHPAIVVSKPQPTDFMEDYGTGWQTAQAKGHLAVSLRTTSTREARVLAARLGNQFEQAWAAFEARIGQMTYTADQDILDEMAHTLAKGFRNYITHYRQMGVATMAPEVRERVFAVIDAELRDSLGIAPLPYDDMFKRTKPAPIKYIETHPPAPEDANPDHEAWIREMVEKYGDVSDSETAIAAHFDVGESRLVDPDDNDGVERIKNIADGLGALLDDYLATCEREGRTPTDDLPSARRIAETLHSSALRLGLPERKPARGLPAPPKPKYSEVPFSEFAASYLKLRCEGYLLKHDDETPHAATGANFQRTSLGNHQSSVRLFTGIIGDLPLADIDKDDVIEFNEIVQRLPKNHGKSSQDNRTIRQVVEDADTEQAGRIAAITMELGEKGIPPAEIEEKIAAQTIVRISATTVKRHQTALKAIFDYAFSRQLIATNPFNGRVLTEAEMKRRRRTERRVERVGWGDNIYALLGSKVFREPLDDIGDPLFWAPLIAVYAGLRMEEICQLRVRDFAREDDVLYVAVQNEIGSQFTKSENSVRKVPLHRALVDSGLPQLVDMRRQAGMARVFPNMPRSKAKGTLSGIMSKRFAYYRRSQGIDEAGLDFHALRTEFQVRLTRAKVPDHVRKGLMGHEQTDVTHANYFRAGERMADLKEYVDRNDIDHTGIRFPFGTRFIAQRPGLRVVS